MHFTALSPPHFAFLSIVPFTILVHLYQFKNLCNGLCHGISAPACAQLNVNMGATHFFFDNN